MTGQAVSKWENGDALPDVALLPALCAVLETSADALLGTTRLQGVEALARGLRERLDAIRGEDQARARAAALGRLLTREGIEVEASVLEVAYHAERGGPERLRGATMILTDGSVIHVRDAKALPPEADSDADIARALALLGDTAAVGVVRRLVRDRREGQALRAEARSDEATGRACDRLVDAGLASVTQEGYVLEPRGVLLAAAVLTVARVLGLGCSHGDRLMSERMLRSPRGGPGLATGGTAAGAPASMGRAGPDRPAGVGGCTAAGSTPWGRRGVAGARRSWVPRAGWRSWGPCWFSLNPRRPRRPGSACAASALPTGAASSAIRRPCSARASRSTS